MIRSEKEAVEGTNMKKTSIFALLLIGIVAVAGSASAMMWHGGMSEENQEAIQTAVENGDYNAWKDAVSSTLTEERFAEMQERHTEREQHQESREAIRDAIDEEDYDAYLEAVNEYSLETETLTEADFETLVEIHQAREAGDWETAQELHDSLDLPRGQGMGEGRGMHGGRMGSGRMSTSQGMGGQW